jgi:CBS domain-containing protein
MADAAPDTPERPLVRVRDAMLSEPRAFAASATAQEAGSVLARVEVRSVLVVDAAGLLVGEVTRLGLVAGVVAAGLDPRTVQLGSIATPVAVTIDADQDVDVAFRLMEELDAERLPVVEAGRLIGALSRSVLQRRLAEDEPPPEPES